jgi:adenylate cyclase
MTENRKIAAILVADVVGYSRLAGADEERTLARLRALRGDPHDPTIAGIVAAASSARAMGSSPNSAAWSTRCAARSTFKLEWSGSTPADRRILFRIGIHLGDIVEESDGDLMGDGVNIAARI